ncbi:MAG: polysaccharide deacetylase family protein [Nitrospiraceae bacterium]|nr:polysaccharide deacetylase family protein [Nitrospiraceae bacterium]
MKVPNRVPVIMYHSVGRCIPDWRWSFLTVPLRVFEDQMEWLYRAGYRTANLEELYGHVSGRRLLPEKSVVLTFDDGYLDNWTHACPVMSRYGFSATVFVTPEFVDKRDIVRPPIGKTTGGAAPEVRGFMSWRELKEASDSGVLSVQSHLMTHTWYPAGPEILDFHHPGDDYYWLGWNEDPANKPYYLGNPAAESVGFGTPVYVHRKSMEANRYFIRNGEGAFLRRYVKQNGGVSFFRKEGWRDELFSELKRYREEKGADGSYESASEKRERLFFELAESKRIIEQMTGAEVNFMCWPGGGYDDEAVAAALRIYKAVTLGSRDRSGARNRPGEDPSKIKRIGAPYFNYRDAIYYASGRYLVRYLDEYRGVPMARKKRQALKLANHVMLRLGLHAQS